MNPLAVLIFFSYNVGENNQHPGGDHARYCSSHNSWKSWRWERSEQNRAYSRHIAEIALSAAAARAESLSVDPSSAPGILSYIHGVRAIRLNLLKRGWRESRQGNVESTVNDDLGFRSVFRTLILHVMITENLMQFQAKGLLRGDLLLLDKAICLSRPWIIYR